MKLKELEGFQLIVVVMIALLLCGILGLGGALALSAGGFFGPPVEEPLAQVKTRTPAPPTATPTTTSLPTFTPAPTGTPTHIPPTNTRVPIPPTETYAPATPTRTPGPSGATGGQGFERAILAAVQLLVPEDGSNQVAGGTGSIVDSRGYILTNFHVIGHESGELYNSQGIIYVAVNPPSLNAPPQVRYIAKLVDGDTELDLALLQITANKDGTPLSGPLNLPAVAIGNSDQMRIGDSLTIVGFPALGLDTVTLTKGTVSGFLAKGGIARAWVKTDAEINPGNSGGLAITEAGSLVGVPSVAVTGEQVSGKISYVRPINLARSLLSKIP
jgi:S1-C subfamily serine protease